MHGSMLLYNDSIYENGEMRARSQIQRISYCSIIQWYSQYLCRDQQTPHILNVHPLPPPSKTQNNTLIIHINKIPPGSSRPEILRPIHPDQIRIHPSRRRRRVHRAFIPRQHHPPPAFFRLVEPSSFSPTAIFPRRGRAAEPLPTAPHEAKDPLDQQRGRGACAGWKFHLPDADVAAAAGLLCRLLGFG